MPLKCLKDILTKKKKVFLIFCSYCSQEPFSVKKSMIRFLFISMEGVAHALFSHSLLSFVLVLLFFKCILLTTEGIPQNPQI